MWLDAPCSETLTVFKAPDRRAGKWAYWKKKAGDFEGKGGFMSKDFGQMAKGSKQFKLGHLGTLNQVIVALGRPSGQWLMAALTLRWAPGSPTGWAS